jgi:hypothetical protein
MQKTRVMRDSSWDIGPFLRVYLTGQPTSTVTSPIAPSGRLSEAAEAWDRAKDVDEYCDSGVFRRAL